MIFLDTNIISYYFNSNERIKEKILEIIDNDENICTTVINVYEILRGFRQGTECLTPNLSGVPW